MAEIYNPRNSKIKNFFISSRTLALFLISACGSSSEGRKDAIIKPGFGSDYVPPPFGYDEPIGIDNHFKVLMPILASPYWVDSLAMENGEEKIAELLGENDSEFLYSFPTARPDYILVTITGWAPASDKMQEAAKEIFSLLSTTLNVDFNRSESSNGYNNIAISQSTQTLTAGFGFFPNSNFELGSDIFVSKTYNSPEVYPNSLTNYDYEILVHEIGHALGLKHPFEGDRSNVAILNSHEDKTEFTAMSYNESSSTFDGTFRILDWMALTKLYGINPSYKSEDDIYYFSEDAGTFILDGAGEDTIDARNSTQSIFVDLRSGSHSHQGLKSAYITEPNQLTISHGSVIEKVFTGTGDDYIVGNNSSNFINTAGGDNQIFPGEGMDVIICGPGSNKIDLSEVINVQDKLTIESTTNDKKADTIFGFKLGKSGDILELNNSLLNGLNFLPLIDLDTVPFGSIANSILRIFGSNLSDKESVETHFSNNGLLQNLKLFEKESALILTAETQNTGEDQNLYSISFEESTTQVHHIATFIGNYLDIDSWDASNFIV